jgi:hypothetical protein
LLTFTLDGHDAEAALIQELQHDVIAWRWDDTTGADRPVFRGVVGQAEDQLTTEQHTVKFTCHDYFAMMGRRFLTATYAVTATDQDDITNGLLVRGIAFAASSGGFAFAPGSYLPLNAQNVNPDGTPRAAKSGTLRDRTYFGQQGIATAITDLAAVQGGFDFDVLPMGMPDQETDALRVFYPRQGVTRTAPVLEYGGSVATVTRALNSDSYGNYVRTLGNNATADPNAAQYIGEAYNADASGVVVGLWEYADNAADVTLAGTLGQQANGALAYYGVLVPSYTLTLAPGFFYAGMFNMGDTLPLVIMSGRLQVNTPVRVVGMSYDINDDGDEDVGVTLGRPTPHLSDLIGRNAADVAALARR